MCADADVYILYDEEADEAYPFETEEKALAKAYKLVAKYRGYEDLPNLYIIPVSLDASVLQIFDIMIRAKR